MITRRSMLLGLGAALAAPAIVKADSLMRIAAPKLIPYPPMPSSPTLYEQMQDVMNAIVRSHMPDTEAMMLDQASYGYAIQDEAGQRIDPRTVIAKGRVFKIEWGPSHAGLLTPSRPWFTLEPADA